MAFPLLASFEESLAFVLASVLKLFRLPFPKKLRSVFSPLVERLLVRFRFEGSVRSFII